jgi:alpha-tubulin suppressor-like RCC1 family protein
MHSNRALAVLPALAAGIIGCGGEKGPTQPAVPTKLAFVVQPSTVRAGVAITPAVEVTVLDAQGSMVTNSTASITVAITSGTGISGAVLGGTLIQTAVSGVASFTDVTIDKTGSGYTLSATAGSLTGATSASFTVNPGAASKLGFTVQPSAAAGAQLITPAVQVAVQDAFENTVTAATDPVTVLLFGANPNAGTLSGMLTVAATQGIATFSNLRIDRPGSSYLLAASAPGLTGATSALFAVTLTFAAVSAGTFHTCGLTTTGAAYCWGYNAAGQLGDGTTTNRWSPALASGGLTFAAVTAGGDNHTCGVTTVGASYCWGANGAGQLGDGDSTDRTSLAAVLGGDTFAAVSAGISYTCGVTTGGAAYCWGDNSGGQLGDGTTTARTSPVAVLGGLTFATVSAAGYAHTCGVTTAGAAYCWGYNASGQLGDSTTTDWPSPVLVSGGLTFAAVSAGGHNHTCGLTTAGAAYCWGDNAFGQLGDGTTTGQTTPVPVVGGLTFGAVSAGGQYSCGVTTGGALYCWGRNQYGQLGDGSTSNRSSPVLVSGGLTFAEVSASEEGDHTCGVTTGGTAYCWGQNAFGQLGNPAAGYSSLVPVRVVQ